MTLAAADFTAGKQQMLTQNRGQSLMRLNNQDALYSIDDE